MTSEKLGALLSESYGNDHSWKVYQNLLAVAEALREAWRERDELKWKLTDALGDLAASRIEEDAAVEAADKMKKERDEARERARSAERECDILTAERDDARLQVNKQEGLYANAEKERDAALARCEKLRELADSAAWAQGDAERRMIQAQNDRTAAHKTAKAWITAMNQLAAACGISDDEYPIPAILRAVKERDEAQRERDELKDTIAQLRFMLGNAVSED